MAPRIQPGEARDYKGRRACPHGRKDKCGICGSLGCKGGWCGGKILHYLAYDKYDGYCIHCFANLFPTDPRVAHIKKKSKENKWVNAITNALPKLHWIHDKPFHLNFKSGCCDTKRRIDLRVMMEHPEAGLYWLCIEIDENRHSAYPEGYEEVRYHELFFDFSGRFVFIRVNPDKFYDGGNWQNPPFGERLVSVIQAIKDVIKEGPPSDVLISFKVLFYGDTPHIIPGAEFKHMYLYSCVDDDDMDLLIRPSPMKSI
jgi:hypothetical protein